VGGRRYSGRNKKKKKTPKPQKRRRREALSAHNKEIGEPDARNWVERKRSIHGARTGN